MKSYPEGVILTLEISVFFGRNISDIAKDVQEAVKESIENYTAINVLEINVSVKGIEVEDGYLHQAK
ncbi:MAG: Asp23/Gls24 family envelope stress response protein [Clostridia bacterium]|nr:Asp23/Gls24 family envelope stress response protein [Clostridia bacterium]